MPRENHVEVRNANEMDRIESDMRSSDTKIEIEFLEIRQERIGTKIKGNSPSRSQQFIIVESNRQY